MQKQSGVEYSKGCTVVKLNSKIFLFLVALSFCKVMNLDAIPIPGQQLLSPAAMRLARVLVGNRMILGAVGARRVNLLSGAGRMQHTEADAGGSSDRRIGRVVGFIPAWSVAFLGGFGVLFIPGLFVGNIVALAIRPLRRPKSK